jgi:hypothetical protein
VLESARSFRRNAVHVRQALEAAERESGAVRVDGGYIEDAGLIERYKRISIPVRRALNEKDRASFAAALAELSAHPGSAAELLEPASRAWQALQRELDSQVVLGGGKVARRQILSGWLDAAAFYDKLDRDRAYDQLIDQWGKAAEGIGSQLMHEVAQAVLLLDEAAAAVLGEPVILPPPPRTPPPPPDPREPWWRRLFGVKTEDT